MQIEGQESINDYMEKIRNIDAIYDKISLEIAT
jgi:hypothetical protein